MRPQQNEAAELLTDDAVFRLQFERAHPTFHNGDPTPVPLGGARIPLGYVEEVPVERDPLPALPEAYHKWSQEREAVKELHSRLTKLGKLVGIASGQQCIIKNANEEKAQTELNEEMTQLANLLELYQSSSLSSTSHEVVEGVESILRVSKVLPESKEAYGDFLLVLNRSLSKLFLEMKRLLAKIKEVKAQTIAEKRS